MAHPLSSSASRIAIAFIGIIGLWTGHGTALAQTPAPATTPSSTDKAITPPTGPKTETLRVLGLALTAMTRGGEFATAAAAKADAEKLAGAASLFRTVSRAHQIHAELVRAQITALGGTPTVDPAAKMPDVKDTAANLATCLKSLTALKETDLPAWRRAADTEGNRNAVNAFRFAREGTIELSRFVKDLSEATQITREKKKDYFVSRTCGFVVEKLDFQKCPVCRAGRDDFEKVN